MVQNLWCVSSCNVVGSSCTLNLKLLSSTTSRTIKLVRLQNTSWLTWNKQFDFRSIINKITSWGPGHPIWNVLCRVRSAPGNFSQSTELHYFWANSAKAHSKVNTLRKIRDLWNNGWERIYCPSVHLAPPDKYTCKKWTKNINIGILTLVC